MKVDKLQIMKFAATVIAAVALFLYGRHIIFSTITTGGAGYQTLAMTCLVVGAILVVVIGFLAFMLEWRIERLYLVAGVTFGILFLFVIPPYSTPDEEAHFDTAYCWSNVLLGTESTQDMFTMYMRECDTTYQGYIQEEADYDQFLATLDNSQVNSQTEVLVEESNNTTWNKYGYILPTIGVALGRAMHLNFGWIAIMGTALNLLLFLVMVGYAIYKIPFGKRTLMVIALLPITLQQASSMSYDCPLIAGCILVTALALRWKYSGKPVKKSEVVIYLITAFFLLQLKSAAYIFVALLPLWLMMNRSWFEGKKRKRGWLIGIGILVILGLIYLIPMGGMKHIIDVLHYRQIIWHWMAYSKAPMDYITHPGETMALVLNTIQQEGKGYIFQLLGGALSWLNIYISKEVVVANLFLLLASLVCYREEVEEPDTRIIGNRRETQQAMVFTGRERIGMFLLAVIPCVLSVVAMMLYWTPDGQATILGVQGRYFLPPLLLLLLSVGRWKKPVLKKNPDAYFAVAMTLVSYMAVISVLYNVA